MGLTLSRYMHLKLLETDELRKEAQISHAHYQTMRHEQAKRIRVQRENTQLRASQRRRDQESANRSKYGNGSTNGTEEKQMISHSRPYNHNSQNTYGIEMTGYSHNNDGISRVGDQQLSYSNSHHQNAQQSQSRTQNQSRSQQPSSSSRKPLPLLTITNDNASHPSHDNSNHPSGIFQILSDDDRIAATQAAYQQAKASGTRRQRKSVRRKQMDDDYYEVFERELLEAPFLEAMEDELPIAAHSSAAAAAAYHSSAGASSNASVPSRKSVTSSDIIQWKRGELLGYGAFGHVYLGLNLESGELMAVKQVPLHVEARTKLTDLAVAALESEIALMKHLPKHENIVAYLGTMREKEGEGPTGTSQATPNGGQHQQTIVNGTNQDKMSNTITFTPSLRPDESSHLSVIGGQSVAMNTIKPGGGGFPPAHPNNTAAAILNNPNPNNNQPPPPRMFNIFLEYVPGGSIASLLKKFGKFNESLVKIYVKQILQGLRFLHQHGTVHRDIKGGNILVDNKSVCKLADFGAAASLQDLSDGGKGIHGTPYWMAPEVINQTGHGRQADIWSFGACVIEMLSGKPPWFDTCPTHISAMLKIATTTEPPTLPDGLSKEAQHFILACFQRDPQKRPNSDRLLLHPFVTGKKMHESNWVPRGQMIQSPLSSPGVSSYHSSNSRMLQHAGHPSASLAVPSQSSSLTSPSGSLNSAVPLLNTPSMSPPNTRPTTAASSHQGYNSNHAPWNSLRSNLHTPQQQGGHLLHNNHTQQPLSASNSSTTSTGVLPSPTGTESSGSPSQQPRPMPAHSDDDDDHDAPPPPAPESDSDNDPTAVAPPPIKPHHRAKQPTSDVVVSEFLTDQLHSFVVRDPDFVTPFNQAVTQQRGSVSKSGKDKKDKKEQGINGNGNGNGFAASSSSAVPPKPNQPPPIPQRVTSPIPRIAPPPLTVPASSSSTTTTSGPPPIASRPVPPIPARGGPPPLVVVPSNNHAASSILVESVPVQSGPYSRAFGAGPPPIPPTTAGARRPPPPMPPRK